MMRRRLFGFVASAGAVVACGGPETSSMVTLTSASVAAAPMDEAAALSKCSCTSAEICMLEERGTDVQTTCGGYPPACKAHDLSCFKQSLTPCPTGTKEQRRVGDPVPHLVCIVVSEPRAMAP